jgi:hypothetical protein
VQLYPAWWSTSPVNDPDYPATSFVNASWARLYLPVRPGMEAFALAAAAEISGQPLDGATATAFLKDLTSYRTKNFGDANEVPTQPNPDGSCPAVTDKFLCLASWTELLPTDGTHLEVLQAATAADDDLSDQVLAIREKLLEAETSALGELAAKATTVHIGMLRDGRWLTDPGKDPGA